MTCTLGRADKPYPEVHSRAAWTIALVQRGTFGYRGTATVEVRDVFKISKVGTVAGCFVQDGTIKRDAEVRLLRDNVQVFKGKVSSLRRFKDDVSEVRNGMECGIGAAAPGRFRCGDRFARGCMPRASPE